MQIRIDRLITVAEMIRFNCSRPSKISRRTEVTSDTVRHVCRVLWFLRAVAGRRYRITGKQRVNSSVKELSACSLFHGERKNTLLSPAEFIIKCKPLTCFKGLSPATRRKFLLPLRQVSNCNKKKKIIMNE